MEGNKYKKLAKNTGLLYILTFSTQFLALATVPYLTRILGPSIYGKLGLSLSLMAYVQLILDFGFILSATDLISKNRNDSEYCSKVFSSVMMIKAVLAFVSGIIMIFLCNLIESWRNEIVLFMLFYISYCINAFLPDFLYRGKEEMKIITIRTVGIKLLFTILIFVLIKDKNDLLRYPIVLGIGNAIAVIWSFYHIRKEYNIKFKKLDSKLVSYIFSYTFPFFISRIASTFYQVATTIILGIMYINQPIVGYYAAADKLMSAVKSASSPIADSLFPYMTKNKDFKLIKKILSIIFPLMIVFALIGFVFSKEICLILFGEEFIKASNILILLIPSMAVILPTYILCFPTLVPMGLSKQANFSNVLGAICQIIILSLLFLINRLNAYTVIGSGVICELIVFVYRLVSALSYKNRK